MKHSRLLQAFAVAAGIAAVVASGLLASALGASGLVVTAGQQAPAAPVFTAEQAAAGKVTYAKTCASCHMPDLSGNNEIPQLAGTAFRDTWGTRSTKELLDYMSSSMPADGPSLSAESYLAITAYVLQSNGAAAGKVALTASTAVPIGSLTQ